MEEKIVIVLNEMSEYLSITQMKKLQDLTIKDAFMFAAVMSDKEQCRHLQKDCIVTQFRIGFKRLVKC